MELVKWVKRLFVFVPEIDDEVIILGPSIKDEPLIMTQKPTQSMCTSC